MYIYYYIKNKIKRKTPMNTLHADEQFKNKIVF